MTLNPQMNSETYLDPEMAEEYVHANNVIELAQNIVDLINGQKL